MKKSLLKNPLFWIILGGFVLRFSGIGEGLPALYNSTEYAVSRYALKMGAARTLDPGIYIYPSLLQYVTVFLYGLVYIIGQIFGLYRDQYDFAVQYLVDPSHLILAGRLLSVLVSSVTILIIYRITARRRHQIDGLIAAGVTAVSFYLLLFSHLGIHETLLIFFTVLTIWKMYQILARGRIQDFFWGGIFAGLAIASKYNAGFLSFGIIFVAFRSKNEAGIHGVWRIVLSGCGLAAGFLVTNPYILVATHKYLASLKVISEQMYAGIAAEHGIPFLWELWQIISHEWFIGLGFFISLFYFRKSRDPFYLASLIVVVPTFFYVSTWMKKGIDYLLVCWPFFIILFSLMLGDVYRRNTRLARYLLTLIFVSSSLNAVHQTLLKILPDTRYEASHWLLDKMETDEKICYDKNGYDLQLVDLSRYQNRAVHSEFLPAKIKDKLDSYKQIPRNVNMVASYEINSNFLSDSVASDFKSQISALKWKSLSQIIGEGTNWYVSDHCFREIYLNYPYEIPDYLLHQIQDMEEFYSDLNKNYSPIAQFSPSFLRAGPVLSIYNLNKKNSPESGLE